MRLNPRGSFGKFLPCLFYLQKGNFFHHPPILEEDDWGVNILDLNLEDELIRNLPLST